MTSFSITDLAKIIERDSKDATYKFALLRGNIEMIQENDHYKTVDGDKITFPMGLLILKWVDYYYPIISSDVFIPQKHGDSEKRTIAFRREFEKVTALYPTTKYADQLFYDLKRGIRLEEKLAVILALIKKIKDTIVKQPMHYIGSSIDQGGEIYRYIKDSRKPRHPVPLNLESIINDFGSFSIPVEMYHVMKVVGSFVTGTHSLIFRWAEFTSGISRDHQFTTSDIISLLKSEYRERDIVQAKDYYANIINPQNLHCVWSGKKITKEMHIDHMIPFVALRNNDLWNLMPSRKEINIRKSDRIPVKELLNTSSVKDRIIYYWSELINAFPEQFKSEIQVSLLGRIPFDPGNWQNNAYSQLITISSHLIEDRGFSPWNNP